MIKEFMADKLSVTVFNSRLLLGKAAAKEAAVKIKEFLSKKAELNIIFAAAPSQNEFLASLIEDGEIDWSRINAFHMDEYIGLDVDSPQGFGNYLKDRIFGKVDFKSVNYLDGNAKDIHLECERYSGLLTNYSADIVCMGIGENGHIAFNDPHVALFNDSQKVKLVELDSKCRIQQVNDGCFNSLEQVPTHAVTLTIPALMAGEYLFCMVPARTKAQAVKNTIEAAITQECPSSILRMHKNARLYIDIESASLIL